MHTPTKVPTVSKISTNKNVNITIIIFGLNIFIKSNLKAIGSKEGGIKLPCGDNFVIPIGIPIIEVISIPSKIAPLTL